MSLGGGGLGTITGYITMDASGVASGVNQANASLGQLEKAVAGNWWGVRNLGLAFAALPLAVAGGAAEAVRSAMQIQDAMVDVARTANLMGSENAGALESLQQQLFDIGKIRATPVVEILGIAESAGALGIATDDIAAFTQTVVDLSSTTDVTTQAASTGLARLAALTGTTAGGFDNLASSIMTAGVETAATESDVLAMSQRLAGLGAALGLNASEIIGWSAAILSAGIKTAEGATQIQKTFIDITRAVSKGGDDLNAWSRIAGVAADQLKTEFDENASNGLLTIVMGLGNIVSAGGDFVKFLDDAGVKESRQVRLLLQLAAAQANNANEHAKASYILQVAANGYQNLERYQSAVEQRNKTFSASLQELQNVLVETGSAIGNVFIGPLQTAIQIIQTLAIGFGILDGPMKAVVLTFTGLITVVSGLGALFLLVGSRIIIAWGALQRLGVSMGQGAVEATNMANSQAQLAAESGRAGVAVADQNQKLLQQVAAARILGVDITILTGKEEQLAQGANVASGALANESAAAASTSGWLRTLGNVALVTTSIMIGLIAYTYALGAAQQRVEDRARKAQAANADLTAQMRRSGGAVNESTTALLGSLPAYQKVIDSANKLGISQQEVQNIVTGTAGGTEWQQFLDKIDGQQGKNSDSANELIRDTYNLRQSWKNSAGDAGVATNAIQQQTEAMGGSGGLGEVTKDAATALNKFRDAQIAIAQAIVDLIDAELAARAAAIDLADSEQSLADAQEAVANKAATEWELIIKLGDAMLKQQLAAMKLKDAENDLATARERAAQRVQDAEDKLADDRGQHEDILDRISEKEQALADLQDDSAAMARKLTDATNKLANSRLKLQHATLQVTELEEHLAYLQQNGAGARDIEEAQLALADAKQNVADATTDVANAEQDLADITDPVKRAKAIAKAERELADLRREAQRNLREIAQDEKDLADARDRQASDRDYLEAQEALAQAFLDSIAASKEVKDVTKDLQQLRDGKLEKDLTKAELEYEQQLYNTAKANVEVQKQTVLMNGGTWDAKDAAMALADELGKLNVKTDEAIAKRDEWIKKLEQAPDIPPIAEPSSGGGGGGGGGGGTLPPFADPTLTGVDDGVSLPPDAIEKAKATWKDALTGIVSGGGAFLAAQLGISIAKALKGKFFPAAAAEALTSGVVGAGEAAGIAGGEAEAAAMLASMGAAPAEVAAAIEGPLLVGGETAAAGAATSVGTIIAAALVAALIIGIGAYFSDFFKDNWFVTLLLSVLFPPALLLLVGAFGKDIVLWLYHGIKDHMGDVVDFFKGLPRRIYDALISAKDWFAENWGKVLISALFPPVLVIAAIRHFGPTVIKFLLNSLKDAFTDHIIPWFKKLPRNILDAIGSAKDWLKGTGYDIILGLKDGIIDFWSNTLGPWFDELPGRLGAFFSNAKQWLKTAGEHIIDGLWDGLTWAWDNTIGDFAAWVWDHTVGPLLDLLGITSPSKVFKEIGIDMLTGLFNGLTSMIGKIGGFFLDLARGVIGFFKDAASWLLNGGKDIIVGLVAGLLSKLGDVATFFWHLAKGVFDFFKDAGSWLLGAGASIIGGLIGGLVAGVGNIASFFWHLAAGIFDFFKDAGLWLLHAGVEVLRGLWDGMFGALGNVWNFLNSLKDFIIDFFKNAKDWLWDAGKNIVLGLTQGITDNIPGLNTVAGGIGGGIAGAVARSTESNSPSKVMIRQGRDIVAGLIIGLKEQQRQVEQAAALVGAAALPQIDAVTLSDLGLDRIGRDPFAGSGGGAVLAGTTNNSVVNNYNNTLDLDVASQSSPQEIIDEWAWFNRTTSTR